MPRKVNSIDRNLAAFQGASRRCVTVSDLLRRAADEIEHAGGLEAMAGSIGAHAHGRVLCRPVAGGHRAILDWYDNLANRSLHGFTTRDGTAFITARGDLIPALLPVDITSEVPLSPGLFPSDTDPYERTTLDPDALRVVADRWEQQRRAHRRYLDALYARNQGGAR
ncbi:hypothetical protein SAMN06265360_10666 [Haloechinothrix alba]|uniref:Uncharacterized protein n=1 Tax=Haloechinothrix alba TaxID=664784 RepID=A0A238WDX2_9PSEU|nr:hypothetical protein [Haloechinothrix alba]SNR44627.1 hypothetical protein SAMN06265360_10666 [Haloechinothrix alba]